VICAQAIRSSQSGFREWLESHDSHDSHDSQDSQDSTRLTRLDQTHKTHKTHKKLTCLIVTDTYSATTVLAVIYRACVNRKILFRAADAANKRINEAGEAKASNINHPLEHHASFSLPLSSHPV
jgi:hypothetical protein